MTLPARNRHGGQRRNGRASPLWSGIGLPVFKVDGNSGSGGRTGRAGGGNGCPKLCRQPRLTCVRGDDSDCIRGSEHGPCFEEAFFRPEGTARCQPQAQPGVPLPSSRLSPNGATLPDTSLGPPRWALEHSDELEFPARYRASGRPNGRTPTAPLANSRSVFPGWSGIGWRFHGVLCGAGCAAAGGRLDD